MFNVLDKRYNEVFLTFKEEGHKYIDNLGNEYKSATTLLHTYAPKFEKDYWLKKKARELNISVDRLAKQWQDITDEACARGTMTHEGLENGIKGSSMFKNAVQYLMKDNGEMITVADIPDINLNVKQLDINEFKDLTCYKYPKIYEMLQWYVDRDYKIYSEIGAFLIDVLVSGCIDVLLLREDNFVIGDWKTNRGGLKFESGYYKKDKRTKPFQMTNEWITTKDKLLPPISHLANCNGNIYNLQLSLYAYMVEYILNIPCTGLWLCHIDSDFVLNQYGMPKRFPDGLYHIKENPQETTTFYPMNYLKQEIINILKARALEVKATRIQSKTLFD